jgi:hypothetical protein
MNRFERRPLIAAEAELHYLNGEYRVVRPGAFVRCAVTGAQIPLEELRYWNVDRQEAYASPAAKLATMGLSLVVKSDRAANRLSEDSGEPEQAAR